MRSALELRRFFILAVLLLGLLLLGAPLRADFTAPAWTRPADDLAAAADLTTYQAWDQFTAPAGPNAPDVADLNPSGVADAYDTSGTGFITSGGNIYSPADGGIAMIAFVPGYDLGVGYQTHFLVQLRTQGTLLDLSSLRLDGVPVSSLDNYAYTELANIALGGFGGAQVDHAFTFTAPGSLGSYALTWNATQAHMSQDMIAIDTRTVAVPEPAAAAFALMGSAAVVYQRRRRPR